ncbi:uncharacterized protein A4U43_C09F10660 [Asparagus officinalis]|uniref:noroxomaritidine synthase n=1 Tax=Asparagus officinalis TaxID=4686 RepID=A0A5P1E6M6_ASPOF|nr:cytochrome P450 86B1 [Asparagus officinalis]ONK58291.1 uncharacterized protein A4U43_C09F10660 [Asparagus officinalis]
MSLLPSLLLNLTLADIAIAITLLFLSSSLMNYLTSKGPMMWPVLGIIPTLFFHISNIYEWATDAVLCSGGTFPFRGMWFGRCYGIITIDPLNIEYMLKTRFSNFPKGRYYRERFLDFLGDGIFNADDQTWKDQRRAATSEMHSARFAQYSVETIRELVHRKLLVLLERLADGNLAVDLQDVFLRFTFDNICTAAFGVDPGCLGIDLPVIPFVWKVMKSLNVCTEKKLKEAIKTVHEFAEKTVSKRRAEFLKLEGLDNRSDLLSRLMEVDDVESGKFKFSDKFLKDFCISFILAGRDTSSVALAWFFWLLNQHPHVEQRILEEISTILGKHRLNSSTILTADELKRMEYLQAALSESLRLYPSVPIDFKEVQNDDVFPDGTRVMKGARVIYSIYSMARDKSIWGNDFREFKPERWIKDGVFVSENQFKYAVFNAGPRLCIGKKFAYMQMKMVAASILMRYHVEVVKGQEVMPKMTTTLYMRNGLKVLVRPRDKSFM